ncbi:MAG: hypothetical protein JW776_15380 [Candidatus Lokiarchaeota archaeon]|nr:hypothetical protein [Candidatus Lokiarchaeota archaeon]
MAKSRSITQILALIGGIIIVIDGILTLLGFFGIYIPGLPGWGWFVWLPNWINAIILIVVGLLVLFSVDLIQGLRIPYNGVWLLILGIAGIIFGGYFLGGALVIIAAILWFLGKK